MTNWTADQEQIFNQLGFNNILGADGKKLISNIKSQLPSAPAMVSMELNTLYTTFSNSISKSADFKNFCCAAALAIIH